MIRTSAALIAVAALAVAGCAEHPLSPSTAPFGGPGSLAAKPGSGPSASAHTLAFSNPGASSGYVAAAAATVSGWITGKAADGNLLAHASSSSYSLTITGTSVAPGGEPAQDIECTDTGSILYTEGLIGGQLAGSLAVDVDQDGSKSNTDPTMDWELSGVEINGRTWRVRGISTNNFPPHSLSGDQNGMAVTTNHIKVLFSRLSGGPGPKNKSDLSFGCRVDVQMTMTKNPV